jgi:hypothetical protein
MEEHFRLSTVHCDCSLIPCQEATGSRSIHRSESYTNTGVGGAEWHRNKSGDDMTVGLMKIKRHFRENGKEEAY